MPRVISIVGYQGAGKTTLIEGLIKELNKKGKKIGVIKHTTGSYSIDTPKKDTWRYIKAGAKSSSIITKNSSAIFFQKPLKLRKVIQILKNLDIIFLEGFKELNIVPRIIIAKEKNEAEYLKNGLEVAIIENIKKFNFENKDISILDEKEIKNLSNIVENKSIPLLPGLNCKNCGYRCCKDLAKAILSEKADASYCVNLK